MTLNIQNPAGGLDVTRGNKRSLLYVTTDPTVDFENDPSSENAPDGSIRIVFTPGDPTAHIESKANGVWNDDGFRFASSSVLLGHDLSASAVGGYIETVNLSEIDKHLKSLVPHIQFDIRGTFGAAHMPILDVRETFLTFPGPPAGEIISTTIGQVFTAQPSRVLHSSTHQVGSISATAPIQVNYFKGTDNTGVLLNRINLGTNTMIANQPLVIIYDSDFGFENEADIFFEFTSTSNISLKTNGDGDIITVQDGHTLSELDILVDELILGNDLSITFDNELHLVAHNRFP